MKKTTMTRRPANRKALPLEKAEKIIKLAQSHKAQRLKGRVRTVKTEISTPEPAKIEVERDINIDRPALAKELEKEGFSAEGDTAYRLYLREIGQVPLLTPDQEIELADRIKKGDASAREQMIKANLRLVVKIARDYEGYGLPLLDLINEGNMGLMKAVERFDPAKGAKLSTYGAWWIKQSIKRALANQSKTIRLPVHVVDKIFHMRKAMARLHDELGREPSDEELAGELDLTPARVSQLREAAIAPTSLEVPLGDEGGDRCLADVVQDENAEDPYGELEGKTISSMLREMIKTLSSREAEILNYRFGLDGGDEKTLEEVGQKFGVTRERIRQIQAIALNKLRKLIEKREAVKAAA